MTGFNPRILAEIRSRFAHIDACPIRGERIFFENAGGALTLKSVVRASEYHAGLPDNQGRANLSSETLVEVINKAKENCRLFMNFNVGQCFVGESGTELIFRILMNVCLHKRGQGGVVLGSTIEHPATRSAAARWADITGLEHHLIKHDDAKGLVLPEDYADAVSVDTHVATILHTSPTTGMAMDIEAIAKAIRKKSPDCFIIVDGIQHAAHGRIDIDAADIDAYVISPYKMFSRHGYGLAWISARLTDLPHDKLIGAPAERWELGTRDAGAYATTSAVIDYFSWLGQQFTESKDKRTQFLAAGDAIHAHEFALTEAMLKGVHNFKGLTELPNVEIIGGIDNPAREGLVSFYIKGMDSAEVVAKLNAEGICTHLRCADYYSDNVLVPLGLDGCIRVSMCHYNSLDEVGKLLAVVEGMLN